MSELKLEKYELECMDGVERVFDLCSTPNDHYGYNQSCGGMRNTKTGEVYALINYGAGRHWEQDGVVFTYDANTTPPLVTKTGITTHGYLKTYMWWLKKKNIPLADVEAVTFKWDGCPVGDAIWLKDGPQEGERISESLPAIIPRHAMHAVQGLEVVCKMSELSPTDGELVEFTPTVIKGVKDMSKGDE